MGAFACQHCAKSITQGSLSGILATCPHCGKLTAVPRETPVNDAADVEIPAAAYVPVSDHRPQTSMSQRNKQFARGGMFAGGGGLIAMVIILKVIAGAIRSASSSHQAEPERYQLPHSRVMQGVDPDGLRAFNDLGNLQKFRAKVELLVKYEITNEQADALIAEHDTAMNALEGLPADDETYISELLKAASERFPERKPVEAEEPKPEGVAEP